MIVIPLALSHSKRPVKRPKGFDAKLGFAVHSQTESWHKVWLMQNIFMIKYILNQKC